MNSVHKLSLLLVCVAGLDLCSDTMADEVNSVSTQPVVKTPVRIDKAHPPIVRPAEYPNESARLGEKGFCAVRMEVDFDGLIRAKQLVVSTGIGRLDAACLAAFADARFIPASVNGKPVANWINLPIDWGQGSHLGRAVTDDQLAVPIVRKDYELNVGPRFYPAESQAMHQEGDCSIHVLVREDGTTGEIKISKSTGYATLDQACVLAIQKALFEPLRKDGTAVSSWADINMSWRLPAR